MDPESDYRYLEIRADAQIDADSDYEFAAKIGKKYDADVRAYDAPGSSRVVVTLEPVKINAVAMG
jgi:hypothetical protein